MWRIFKNKGFSLLTTVSSFTVWAKAVESCPEQYSQPPSSTRELCPGMQGVKRGTLLKVRHDGTALLIHSFSFHIFS